MTKEPFFSIIIPCLNEEKSLPLLLKDLAGQTLQDFEVIVVDGQSQDKTVVKAEELESYYLLSLSSPAKLEMFPSKEIWVVKPALASIFFSMTPTTAS